MTTDEKPAKHGIRWQSMVAGCAAGLTPVLVLHPLDVLKTRLQVQDGVRGSLPLYQGVRDAARTILRDEGWRSLYAGLSPALIGAGVSWGVYFAGYNRAKARYQRRSGVQKLPPQMHLLAAAEGGALACCLTNPIWVVKTRLELQRGVRTAATATTTAASATSPASAGASAAATAAAGGGGGSGGGGAGVIPEAAAAGRRVATAALRPYRGMVDAVSQIAREEGLAGFYRGLGPSLLLVSHGAIQFMVYEELRSLSANWKAPSPGAPSSGALPSLWGWRHHQQAGGTQRQPSSAEIVGIGALSKVAATVITYPSQVVRSRLQQRMARRAIRYRSGWDVLRITLRREGVGGLYKGLLPNVLRVMPQAALTFLVYEKVMQYLSERAAAAAFEG